MLKNIIPHHESISNSDISAARSRKNTQTINSMREVVQMMLRISDEDMSKRLKSIFKVSNIFDLELRDDVNMKEIISVFSDTDIKNFPRGFNFFNYYNKRFEDFNKRLIERYLEQLYEYSGRTIDHLYYSLIRYKDQTIRDFFINKQSVLYIKDVLNHEYNNVIRYISNDVMQQLEYLVFDSNDTYNIGFSQLSEFKKVFIMKFFQYLTRKAILFLKNDIKKLNKCFNKIIENI